MTGEQLLTPAEFAQSIKAKYPDYASVPDEELATRMLEKYPEYRDRVKTPDFKTHNAADEAGNPIVSGIGHAWDVANTPLVPQIAAAAHAIASHLDAPALDRGKTDAQIRGFLAGATEGAGNVLASFTSPVGIALTLAGLGEGSAVARYVPGVKALLELPAVQALQKAVRVGGGSAFAAHGAGRVAAGDSAADRLAGVAEMAGGLAGALPARVGLSGVSSRLNAVDQAANAFGAAHDVPIDAATATGNRFVRGVQKVAGESMLGAPAAERAQAAQTDALRRVAGELKTNTHPEYASPETAGEAIAGREGAIRGLIGELDANAQKAYGKLREFEADPKLSERVHTAPVGSRTFEAIRSKLAAGLEDGQAPTVAELRGMRQIAIELESQPFTKFLLRNPERGKGGTTLEHVEGTGGAGASVYHDILDVAPGTSSMTRDEMLHGVLRALEDGEWTNAGRGALEVARQRLRQGYVGPNVDETIPILGTQERIGLPVNLRQAKQILTPLYERLMREKEIVPPMGDKAQALLALHRMMGGPDVAPASVVDGVLSDLKAMARTDVPELRSTGQGAVAQAIKVLEPPFQEAIRRGGPGATRALEEGRGSVQAKYWAGDVLRQLVGDDANRLEPVKAFRKLVAPEDAGIALLRKVREIAPARVPELARAYLEDLLTTATQGGGFEKAATVQNDWNRLGPQTKQILFGDQAAAIGEFLHLAKRIAENPNTSGTALTQAKVGELMVPIGAIAVGHPGGAVASLAGSLTMGGIAKLLYSPKGVKLLTRGLELQLRPGGASGAQRQAFALDLARMAKSLGADQTTTEAKR